MDVATLTELLREAEEHHGEYEATAPKHHWSGWYAAYLVARERGRTSKTRPTMLRSTWAARVREGRHHLRHDLSAALSPDQYWLTLLLRRYWAIPSSNRPDGVHLVLFPPRVVHRWIRIARATGLSSRQGYEGNDMTQSSVVERSNQAVGKSAIRPFRVNFPDAELAECAGESTRPGGPSGKRSRMHRKACSSRRCRSSRSYWGTEYDWRKCEARLNALPHFITEIDGLDIHFIHVHSKHENALPVIVTHGWPGSVIEQLKIIDPLTNPTAHGGTAADAFDVVIPSMPGYGFSGKPTDDRLGPRAHRAGMDRADEAPGIQPLRRAGRRLGCAHRRTDGCAGAAGADRHPHQHAGDHSARDRAALAGRQPPPGSRAEEKQRLRAASPSSTSMVSATPTRWRTARRRCTGSSIHRSAWRHGSSTTTRTAMR